MTLNKPKKISTGTPFETEMLLIRNLRYVTILGLLEKILPNALVSKGDLYGLQAMEFYGFNRHLDFLLDWKQCSGRFNRNWHCISGYKQKPDEGRQRKGVAWGSRL